MKNIEKDCDFCTPAIREMMSVHNLYTPAELNTLIEGVMVQGRVFKCGELRLTCLPLMLTARELGKRKGEKNGN
jgi:hypothetical protein